MDSQYSVVHVYSHSDFSTDIGLVHLFVGLTRECETWPKIMRRVIGGKQVQKEKIKNIIKIYLEFKIIKIKNQKAMN
ncbi:hypothetical protein T02_11944 [Trichinella nativa]|uniref:Uncharacterized protein n=1 Tax=Trichinella nativa TaxID=6335 RepID=A0A0V1KSQ3_9BILA|nr:hypothetical protein T02_1582 [Trichinella nativa]KRZ50411.1 hypothetical protein T02_11944 [Trichinella nativa]